MTLKPFKPFSTIQLIWSWKNAKFVITTPCLLMSLLDYIPKFLSKPTKLTFLISKHSLSLFLGPHHTAVSSLWSGPWCFFSRTSFLGPYSCMLFCSPGPFSSLLSFSSHHKIISFPLWRLSWMPQPIFRKSQIPYVIWFLISVYFYT